MNTSPNHSLFILLWNADVLSQHRQHLQTLLYDKNIDIALTTETHFTTRSNFSIPRYTLYRTDFPGNAARGGAAILIHFSISHHLLPSHKEDFLQATLISIDSSPFNLIVAAVYCPPRNVFPKTNSCHFFQSFGPHFLTREDWNSNPNFKPYRVPGE